MFDHILSPDGTQIWSDDYQLPKYMLEKWIPKERWEEWLRDCRLCPSCHSFLEIDFEDKYAECRDCYDGFKIVKEEPLTVEPDLSDMNRFHLPLKFKSKLLSKKGLEFQARGNMYDCPPEYSEMIDGINESLDAVKAELLDTIQAAIDDLEEDWDELYEDTEIIEEVTPQFVLEPEYLEVTADFIHSGKSSNGGWSKEQLECLGVSWAPKKGDITTTYGTFITKSNYDEFLSLKDEHLDE